MSFEIFAQQVHARFNALSKHELFVVGNDNRIPEQAYIAAFPPGTNPLFKTNTEHHCTCCFQFLRNAANVVAIVDGKMQTLWDGFVAPAPYDTVAAKMHEWVLSQPITNLFRTTESAFGKQETFQKLEDGVKKWNHFYADVAQRHKVPNPDAVTGGWRSMVEVFKRGLETLSRDALTDVIDLASKTPEYGGLYRGAEFLPSLNAFRDALDAYFLLSPQEQELFLWANGGSHLARFRNTMIGTLVQDLSEGKGIEGAVKAYEAKAAPENYKRPTAIVTPGMIATAMKMITELNLEPALARRYAKLSDVSVNNVLWVNNDAKSIMKSPLENLLMDSVKKPVKEVLADDITIDTFMRDVLPTASSISLLVRNSHRNNFVSLTAPVHADAERLFKWDNGFAWSYSGNIADSSMRAAVVAKGGRVDGVFRFTHSWNHGKRNASLMDLHVFMPGNNRATSKNSDHYGDNYGNDERVGWNNRKHHASGGVQDVDYVAAAPEGYVPVENITFPDLSRMPEGQYKCCIHNWSLRQPTQGGFKAEIEFEGKIFEYDYDQPLGQKQWIDVATVTLKDGRFSIEHHIAHGATSQAVWGIKTETFVEVDTVMLSPNFWDDNATGNKHYIFALKGCKQPGETRGIYNEFLRSDLEQHRKAFELAGEKTKCQPTEDQISGLGFSSTRGDNVTVQVKIGNRTRNFNVQF
jgi:hypothetical protein